MDSKVKVLLRLIIVPNLRSVSAYFAMKDADGVGNDDRIARIVAAAADELERYLNETEVPPTVR